MSGLRSSISVFGIACIVFAAASSQAMGQQVTLVSSSGSVAPGGTVTLGLSQASSGGALPVAVQWTISYSASVVSGVSVVAGSSATGAGKNVTCSSTTGSTICIVYGMNQTVIGDGVLANATFTISPSAPNSTVPIQAVTVTVASAAGTAIPGSGQAGSIAVSRIVPPAPSVTSVSPNNSTGSSQTFSFVFSDTQTAQNITGMAMLFNTSLSYANSCYIIVDRNAGTVALAYDSALGASNLPIRFGCSA